jgi:hypothetical protein
MKRKLYGLLVALALVVVGFTASTAPASAMTCAWNVSQTGTAWDGTNYLWITFEHTWQYDFWGSCQYSYHITMNSSNGGPARPLNVQANIRVWVNGAYQFDSDMAIDTWYGYGYEWHADTKWVTYGTYPPSADTYTTRGKTDAPGAIYVNTPNILFTF